MKNNRGISFGLLLLFASLSTPFAQTGAREIANLKAFSKLYGYVRFFHPSDEAANLDWDRFSLYGTEQVLKAKDDAELKDILKTLFLPVAPTARIYLAGETPSKDTGIVPAEPGKFKVASWQHFGLELPYEGSIYKSVRLNCRNKVPVVPKTPAPAVFAQTVDAKEWRGREFLVTAFVRAESPDEGDAAYLWVRVDRDNKTVGFFDNMSNRPILSPVWTEYRISGTVNADAVTMILGGMMAGTGKAWYDDFTLSFKNDKGEWTPVAIADPGFETDVFPQKETGWRTGNKDFGYAVDDKVLHSGTKAFCVSGTKPKAPEYFIPEKLFDRESAIGDMIEEKIADTLSCRIPLALYCDGNGTYGKNSAYPLASLTAELDKIKTADMTGDNLFLRLGNVVAAWNVFRHFYPYFDVVKTDWEAVFDETIRRALQDKTADEFYDTLRRMVAKLEDGHGVVYYAPAVPEGGFPFRVEWIENKVVVTASEGPLFQKGDIITTIDGRTGEEEMKAKEELVSGAPQLRRYRALNIFGQGKSGTTAEFEVVRNGAPIAVRALRARTRGSLFFNALAEFDYPDFREIEPGVYYINTSISESAYLQHADELTKAKGIIIDWRWNGKYDPSVKRVSMLDILAGMTDTTVHSAKFMVPQVISPDGRNWEFEDGGWPLEPKKPRLGGKILMIDEPSVVSFGETCMGIVENYKLAETVGAPTAGTNGNANYLNLPGKYRIMWTGMKVLKHDGSQHHLIGIPPTYPVEKTVKAVLEGRDEYLEKAIEVIKASIK